jgi:type I restriction enzyme S subunit
VSGAKHVEHAEALRRFKPYPEYRVSGVEWLDEVPVHWEVKPLKRALRSGNADGSLIKGRMHQESGEGLFPGFSASGQDIWVEEAQHHEPGIVLSAVGARCGKSFKADGDWTAVANTHVIFPHGGFDRDFLWYLTNDETFWDRGGTAQPFVRVSSTLQLSWCFPSLDEQRAIAAFLDRETARIDELVAKKERLIELLQEQRTALIARAVTKGLDPTVQMKDSGVEWLGEIPAHWEVKRTKFAARLRSGHTPSRQHTEYWVNCTIPWFGLADVWQIRDGQIEFVYETAEMISELGLAHSAARLLPKGTVILSRTASVGFSAILGVDMATTQDFVNWVCGPTLRPAYLLYVFRAMKHEFRRLTMGSTHQTIYMPDVGGFSTPLPPLAEQDQIFAFIREETARVDALIANVHEAIERLQELRTALISAAVAGKIDVREGA